MAVSHPGQSSLVHSLATLLRNDGDLVLGGSSTLTLPAASLQQLTRLFEQYLLSRSQQHGFLALPSHPADTASLLQLQFLFDVLQKTVSLKLINPPEVRLQSVVKIFPFKSLKYLELKRIPSHCLEGLRGIYSQLEVFICSRSLSSLEELLSLCGGDLSSALPWLELRTLNFSYNSIVALDQSLSLLNVLKSLDLSHNKIQDCAEFLMPLSELEQLNLGYNHLQRAPMLSLSARAKLVTLILRNNELETINGVEQLSSLQHLDLAYNLLLEHSQLAPLSLLHSLNTLNLEGNPLPILDRHITTTFSMVTSKITIKLLKFQSGMGISTKSSAGHSCSAKSRQSTRPASSGAGEFSDSLVRPDPSLFKVGIVLPHQQEIERMSNFRDKLGEDWLRYQHHLDEASTANFTNSVSINQQTSHNQTLHNGHNTTMLCPSGQQPSPPSSEVQNVLPPPLLTCESKTDASEMNGDLETDITLLWPGERNGHTESTFDESMVDGPVMSHRVVGSKPSPESQSPVGRERVDTREEEEEEDLGVDLCHPLLVGVLSDSDEEKDDQVGKGEKMEVFLCIKQGMVLEVDMQRGRERCRLELFSLARVETTEATWTRGDTEEILPAVELQFDYISRAKKRKRYVLLDDDPLQALQALTDVLSHVMEENQQRDSELLQPSCVRMQCLRCRSEFMRQGDGCEEDARGRAKRIGAAMLPEDEDEDEWNEAEGQREYSKGNNYFCKGCGSDHVVQLAGQTTPYSSTPLYHSSLPNNDDDHLDMSPSVRSVDKAYKGDYTDDSISGSPFPETAIPTEDTAFVTAQGSSFFIGEDPGDTRSLSDNTECQSKEDLAGSYHYTATGVTPTDDQVQPAGRLTPNDDLDLLSEDYKAVDHRLKLFLDVEVFEEEEELHSFLKMSAVRFGEPGEVPALLVVSNKRIYFLEMTSDVHRGQLSDWLQKRDSYPITELSYLEVGLRSQSIHMEFGDRGLAYTLLVRDSERCKRFFGLLTGIVREMAHKSDSMLKSISTTRLSPQHHLWHLVCEDIQADVEDGQLQLFYILAFVLQEDIWMPLTVLATRETLYLLKEDHQWRKTANESEEQSSGKVAVLETLPISCVSSIHVWPSDQCRIDIKLYDETVKQEKMWCVRSESSELLQGLLAWVRTQWEAMFGVKLHTSLQDKVA
ncbi:Serine/threonine-protein kinase 11-interacting protein [Channa argus]|uniref:Serine/threonine-protein kinase 11-interacting protein n=1 Tax=Channa argus TaxID=215402 RepID=A0A6G1PEK6_CHAAH|nr:Serine/threonine-protein kinase 11-interacting protein [Channa argus]